MRKLTYFIATSVDGFIGAPDGNGDCFYAHLDPEFTGYLASEYPETVSALGREHLGIAGAPPRHFDAVIMGRRTYEPGLAVGMTSPYGHLPEQYVVSRGLTAAPDPEVRLLHGDIVAAVRELKARDGLGIWLCGGADLAAQLIDEIDEFVVKTYPVFLGTGMPMSRAGFGARPLELTWSKTFGGGQTVTAYARRR
ncbi:dihydrofolate reductase family protein [Streptomyces sp. NPDC047014]|uniref:dihydrofolate reductase family protein n=1 Tax=Streptomyces sp. NPDC047014 TaxID=3155736 RepID=UPI0033DDB9A3